MISTLGGAHLNTPVKGHSAGGVTLEVLIKDKPAKRYVSPTDSNVYIEGRDGSEFTLQIKNNNNHRVLVILSVDGLSVVDGEAAGEDSKGYIVNGYQTINVPGWTVDQETVAKFTFSGKKGGSYAEKIGQDAFNKGVIGVLVVDDKDRRRYRNSYNGMIPKGEDLYGMATSCSVGSPLRASGATLSASNAALPQDMGTDFGAAADYKTTLVDFTRGAVLGMIELFYDDAQGLKRRGINISEYDKVAPRPSAFPKLGCRIPEGWSRG